MASKNKVRRRAKSMTVPVAVVAGFGPIAYDTIRNGWDREGFSGAIRRLSLGTTGFDPENGEWYRDNLIRGMGPVVLGFGIHWIAGKLGINRALGRTGIPLLRV